MFYPEYVPGRSFVSAKGFSLAWTKQTAPASSYIVYTQMFTPDDKSLVYVTRNSLDSVDIRTGEQLWSVPIPTDSIFHLYNDRFFTVNSDDSAIPFAPQAGISIPGNCASSNDARSLSVYEPHTGQKVWELSYPLVSSSEIYFDGDTAYMTGLTIAFTAKYISIVKIDITSGNILDIDCINLNDYSRPSDAEGQLSANFVSAIDDVYDELYVLTGDRSIPYFTVDGIKLNLFNLKTKQSSNEIKFWGFPLNPFSTQIIVQNDLLIVYLDDSDQFFAFQMK
jgi:hypothetical protein